MKGILLAGGVGSRLHPSTLAISKQLLPVYDKPMIYYPLSTLMIAGIREVLLISTPRDTELFKSLLKDGSQWGISIEYCTQNEPNGIAEAFIIGENFIKDCKTALILGDNIFYGNELSKDLEQAKQSKGASIFVSPVRDPERYGIIEFDRFGRPINLIEKPKNSPSRYAITGLYFYDKNVVEIAKSLKKSQRGELEITDINKHYLDNNDLNVFKFGRGHAWLDTGTHESLLEAGQFVATLEHRQGLKIACLEEIAYRCNYISFDDLERLAFKYSKNNYGNYLNSLLKELK